MALDFEKIYNKSLNDEYLTRDECISILNLPSEDFEKLLAITYEIRKDKQNLMFKAVNSIFASGYLTADGQNIDDTIKLIEDAGFKYEIE